MSPEQTDARLWLAEIRDELSDLPAYLLALVLALAILAGVATHWLGG